MFKIGWKTTQKKKGSATGKFIIASAGKNKQTSSAELLHLSSADSNKSEAIKAQYEELMGKGLDAGKIKLVAVKK